MAVRKASEAKRAGNQPRSQKDVATELRLNDEVGRYLRSRDLRSEIEMLQTAASTAAPRATAAAHWLSERLGYSVETVGAGMMLVYILATETVGVLGLFSVFGRHAPQTLITAPKPAASRLQPAAEALTVAPTRIAEAKVSSNPIKAFMDVCLKPAAGSECSFADIQSAWTAWCAKCGLPSAAINLSMALSQAGYVSEQSKNRRKVYKDVRIDPQAVAV
jgi:hypothetical protein